LNCLSNFSDDLHYISMTPSSSSVVIKSHRLDALQRQFLLTEARLSHSVFDRFDFQFEDENAQFEYVLPIREFKALLSFCEGQEFGFQIELNYPGDIVTFIASPREMLGNACSAILVLSSVQHHDEDEEECENIVNRDSQNAQDELVKKRKASIVPGTPQAYHSSQGYNSEYSRTLERSQVAESPILGEHPNKRRASIVPGTPQARSFQNLYASDDESQGNEHTVPLNQDYEM